MEKTSLFTPVGNQPNKLFTDVSNKLPGAQGTALVSIASNFAAIDGIMVEGKVSPAHIEFATQKLYDAYLAVEKAITLGWHNGQGGQY